MGPDSPEERQQAKEGHTQVHSLESGSSGLTLYPSSAGDSSHLFVSLLSSANHGAWFYDCLRLGTKALGSSRK